MSWHCQYAGHEGDRVVSDPRSRWTKRVTYMQVGGAHRKHERNVPNGNRCGKCADLEHAAEFKDDPNQDQGGLF